MPAARFSVRVGLILVLAMCMVQEVRAGQWTASSDHLVGLPLISRYGASALSSSFFFSGKEPTSASHELKFDVLGPLDYSFVVKYEAQNVDLTGRISKRSNRQMAWVFDLDAHRTEPEVDSGGIAFKFDLAGIGSELGEPELLSTNRGWTWGRVGGTRFELLFDPPMAAVYFEQGQKSEVRALLFKGGLIKGSRRQTITLTISGEIAFGPAVSERFGKEDPASWPPDALDWESSPVDMSFLNKPEMPAGKRGFLKVLRDKFVFEDGAAARFWGTNLTSYALFQTSKENARRQARRLSQLGFNLVRLHHHDSLWVDPNVFGDKRAKDTQTLSSAMLEKLDWWIQCLKDEGIYVWLDLHVGRKFKPGDDILGFDEISKGNPTADPKGYNYVNTGIQSAMRRFNEDYVNHLNKYTGNRYKDEPAIIAMLITNENDLTNHYGNVLLPDSKVPKHHALYMDRANAFAAAHDLPRSRVWRSWEHGPSKIFLNDLEQRFHAEMIGHLRKTGVKVPIVTTSTWGSNPLSSLPALTTGDVIDAHSYGSIGELEKNPIHVPNMMHWLAAAQIAGLPLSVTEWNVEPFPVHDRHLVPLYMAASSRLQGWGAMMQYAYTQAPPNGPGYPSNWHAFNDPALIATLPAAALLFRRGDVQEASTIYAFAPDKEQLFGQSISPRNAAALRTAAEKGKLVLALPQVGELPWLQKSAVPAGARVIMNPGQSLIDSDAAEAVSDNGELKRNWEQGIYTINTSRTQAAMGWIGGRRIELADVRIEASTPNATVCIQSLDGRPIGKSGSILVSLGARSVPTRAKQLPFRSEPVLGQIDIQAPRGLKLYPAGQDLKARRTLSAPYRNGRYTITLQREPGNHWLVLKK